MEEIQQLVDGETWLSGEETEKYFNIEVVEVKEVAAFMSDYFDKYQKTPSKIVVKAPSIPKKDLNEQLKMHWTC